MAREGGGLFAGFRVLGRFSGHVPHVLRYHGRHREFYLATAVGRSVHTYNVSNAASWPSPLPHSVARVGPWGGWAPGGRPVRAPAFPLPRRFPCRRRAVVKRERVRRAAALGGKRGCSAAGGGGGAAEGTGLFRLSSAARPGSCSAAWPLQRGLSAGPGSNQALKLFLRRWINQISPAVCRSERRSVRLC